MSTAQPNTKNLNKSQLYYDCNHQHKQTSSSYDRCQHSWMGGTNRLDCYHSPFKWRESVLNDVRTSRPILKADWSTNTNTRLHLWISPIPRHNICVCFPPGIRNSICNEFSTWRRSNINRSLSCESSQSQTIRLETTGRVGSWDDRCWCKVDRPVGIGELTVVCYYNEINLNNHACNGTGDIYWRITKVLLVNLCVNELKINPIHLIGSSLKKHKPCTKV